MDLYGISIAVACRSLNPSLFAQLLVSDQEKGIEDLTKDLFGYSIALAMGFIKDSLSHSLSIHYPFSRSFV